MTGRDARQLAERVLGTAPDRYGVPVIDHVRRVAAAVPREARTVAWLHEVLECTTFSAQDLRAAGVSEEEVAAVALLTRDNDADEAAYEAHIVLIAEAPGRSGRLARIVKRADLHDRLRHQDARASTSFARPAYGVALTRLAAAPAEAGIERREARGVSFVRAEWRAPREWSTHAEPRAGTGRGE